ncbi:hypothetical protein KDL45_17160, partial [bacterium]|nr:hypothetical protein [bacterium]
EQTEHIGIDELFEAGGLCAVEWADKFPGVVPEDAVRVELTVSGPTARKVRIVLPEPFDPEREAFYKAIAAMTPNNGTREARV